MVPWVDLHRSSELFVVCILSYMEDVPRLFENAKSVTKMKINRSRAHLFLVERVHLDGPIFNQLEDSFSPQRRQVYSWEVLIFR